MAQFTRKEMRTRIQQELESKRKGLTSAKLAAGIRINRSERARFMLTLDQMIREGSVVRDSKGRCTLAKGSGTRARLLSLSRGFGFARPEAGGADCFIPGRDLGGALPGDTLLLQVNKDNPRGPSGRVMSILETGPHLYAGRLVLAGPHHWEIAPDAFIRYALPIRKSNLGDAVENDKVRFSVERDEQGDLYAIVTRVYGSADSARVCADAIVDAAGIPTAFPAEVVRTADSLKAAGISEDDLKDRTDLRSRVIFTIDGADAKDLDDAVSLERVDDGWLLGVHIADVSNYVRENTPLDAEAQQRGTSVYFADRVIPMLPVALSNGICSLNANEDKLTLSVLMTLDKHGACRHTELRKSIIRSCVRGVYGEINALLDGSATDNLHQKYAMVGDALADMKALADMLRRKAAQRGTMDLISSEPVFILDENGHPADIRARASGESEGIIEQFMIAANEQVAAFALQNGLPFVFRVHEQPDPEKLQNVSLLAHRLGLKHYRLDKQSDQRDLMDEAKSTPYARLISDQLLRSMAKARYSEKGLGHYGLALKDYCHFTSPIRRYPDLAIHRILTDCLGGQPIDRLTAHYASFVQRAASFSSEFEIRAMTAERECESCYKAEYMSRFIGEEFEGVISSVSAFGFFVELPNSVEGLVRMETLPERELRFDEVASLVTRNGRAKYTVGQRIAVRVTGTDVSAGQIDFEPVNSTPQ